MVDAGELRRVQAPCRTFGWIRKRSPIFHLCFAHPPLDPVRGEIAKDAFTEFLMKVLDRELVRQDMRRNIPLDSGEPLEPSQLARLKARHAGNFWTRSATSSSSSAQCATTGA